MGGRGDAEALLKLPHEALGWPEASRILLMVRREVSGNFWTLFRWFCPDAPQMSPIPPRINIYGNI